MKRALVDYASSDEETQPRQKKWSERGASAARDRPAPCRKLPPLSSSLTVPTPVDNPALHQGRTRTVPHVEGQYAAYIYVPLVLAHRDPLHALVEDALALARARVPSLHPIGRQEHDGTKTVGWELHISLSHPLFLRAHQREDLKRAIQQVASSIAPFDASFTAFSELMNDERTRTFLALELGAGHGELRRCPDLLEPTLHLLRQKVFYVDPKFHASIAWALLEKPASSSDIASLAMAREPNEIMPSERAAPSVSPGAEGQPCNDFHCIPHFPPTLVPSLNEAYAAKLSQARTGGFVVDRVSMKIGKDVFTWPLSGMK